MPIQAKRCLRPTYGPRSPAALVLGLSFILSGLARAESDSVEAPTLPSDVTLNRLLAETLAVLPELHQTETMAAAESEKVAQAGALADPMLQLGIQNDGFSSIEIGRMETSFV